MKNTKYLLPILFVFLFTLIPLQPVFAENSGDKQGLIEQHKEELRAVKAEKKDELQNQKEEKQAMMAEQKEARQELMEAKQGEMQQNREEHREQVCEQVNNRIKNRVSAYETNKSSHVEQYENFMARLGEISENLSERDLDVSNLLSALDTLDSMVKEYASLYQGFIDTLNDSQDLSCGNVDGAYLDALKGAKEQRSLAREKRKEITDFYANEIRPIIKGLRDQAREQYRANLGEEGDN